MEDIILYEKEGDIGKITINKPEQRNSLDLNTINKLIEAFNKSAKNGDVCVIYAAEGKHFTVGADLKYGYELLTNPDRLAEAMEFLQSWQVLTRAMLAHPGVIIAGLHGWVIGGGFEQLLCCDLRIAATDTKIMLPELGMGLFFSNASTKLLPRLIGEGRAKQLMYLGEEINAEEALNIGLVNQICKPESLRRILRKTANSIVQKDHLALRITKKLLNENQDKNLEATLDSESIAMLETAQSEGVKRRITQFATEKH
ncbi:Crotonyl-CoA hydratase [subsurface metagenome]